MFDLHQIFATTPSPSEKTAGEAAPAPAAARAPGPTASSAVAAAVTEALSAGATKVASEAGAPAATLTKLAGEVAALEKQARVQEGNLIGRAICDGFMAQLGVYEKVAAEMQGAGADAARAEAEKQAAWNREFADTEAQIEKTAAQHYLLGLELAREALT